MTINVTKEDLVNMVLGISPYYSAFDNVLISECGSFMGDNWTWSKSKLEKLSVEDLCKVYDICKNSWK